jgi:hypothetical protein
VIVENASRSSKGTAKAAKSSTSTKSKAGSTTGPKVPAGLDPGPVTGNSAGPSESVEKKNEKVKKEKNTTRE